MSEFDDDSFQGAYASRVIMSEVEIVAVSCFRQLTSSNYNESQIFAGMTAEGGKRLMNYRIVAEIVDLSTIYTSFINCFDNSGEFFASHKSSKKYNKSDEFQSDLFVQFDECTDVSTCLSQAVEWTKNINSGKSSESIHEGSWFMVEISESANHLRNKLWQLERALTILPPEITTKVACVAVLINGDEQIANAAINRVKKLQGRLSQLPVYVGWVPTRNIFAHISSITKIATEDRKRADEDRKLADEDRKSLRQLIITTQVITLIAVLFLTSPVVISIRRF